MAVGCWKIAVCVLQQGETTAFRQGREVEAERSEVNGLFFSCYDAQPSVHAMLHAAQLET